MQTTIKVDGMTCKNCERAVKEALIDIKGVTNVVVNLDNGNVTIDHTDQVKESTFKQAVKDQGYDVS